ncbi:MAG: spore coat U domain-containing protein [Luteimonas sp.]
MTPYRLLATLVLLAASCLALPAAAQSTSTTFQVRISISSVCAFTAPGATDVDFGPQPSTAVNVDADGALTVTCTPGTAYNIALDAGQSPGAGGVTARNMSNGTAALVPYQLFRDPGRSLIWGDTVGTNTVANTGTGTAQTIPVYGRVLSANQPAGSYLDIMTATVVY